MHVLISQAWYVITVDAAVEPVKGLLTDTISFIQSSGCNLFQDLGLAMTI